MNSQLDEVWMRPSTYFASLLQTTFINVTNIHAVLNMEGTSSTWKNLAFSKVIRSHLDNTNFWPLCWRHKLLVLMRVYVIMTS